MTVLLNPAERTHNGARNRRGVDFLKTRLADKRRRDRTREPLQPVSEIPVENNGLAQLINATRSTTVHNFLRPKYAFRFGE